MDMYPKKSRYVCTYVQFNAIFERGPQLQLGKLRQSRQTANQPSCQNHEPLSFLSCHVMSCHASSHLVELVDVRTFHVTTYVQYSVYIATYTHTHNAPLAPKKSPTTEHICTHRNNVTKHTCRQSPHLCIS